MLTSFGFRFSRRPPLQAATTVAIVLAAIGSLALARVEPPKRPTPVKPLDDDKLTPILFGADFCAPCHSPGTRLKSDLCRLIEFSIWDEKDKHKNAFNVLKSERSQAMGRALGSGDPSKDRRCVACHGIVAQKDLIQQQFSQEEGVSCIACHGGYQEWVTSHQVPNNPKWRKLTRREKQTDYGMVDLWDPVVRTRKCASCHIGNIKEEKYLTHEMYAAGHPPLPGLEVDSFCEQEPRHWQLAREKPPKVREDLRIKDAEFERTRLVVLGGLEELRASAELLADAADRSARESAALDLTHFDCQACHHDLKVPGWRQARGYFGRRPGRPQPRPWPLVLAKTALRQLDVQSGELDALMEPLRAAFDAQPFGDPSSVAEKSRELSKKLEAAEDRLAKTRFDQTIARRLLLEICRTAGSDVPDYDSARQLAWAFASIYDEIHPKPVADKEIRTLIAELKAELKTDLPATRSREILDEIGDSLDRVARYEPCRFQAIMKKLAALAAGD